MRIDWLRQLMEASDVEVQRHAILREIFGAICGDGSAPGAINGGADLGVCEPRSASGLAAMADQVPSTRVNG